MQLELSGVDDQEALLTELEALAQVQSVAVVPSFQRIFGKRVIVIGGGAQVGMVAQGAISEADRHNIRGERISVDTIPLVGEERLAAAVRAVARLHRARILVLAGALMGGDISNAVRDIQRAGIIVLCTNMDGAAITEALEHELNVLILDSVAVTLWRTMLLANADPRILSGWGRVFQSPFP